MLTCGDCLQDTGSSQQCYCSHFVDEKTEACEIKYAPHPTPRLHSQYVGSESGLSEYRSCNQQALLCLCFGV